MINFKFIRHITSTSVLLLILGSNEARATIDLNPLITENNLINTAITTGIDANFYKVNDQWHGSSVLWNETTQSFGTGVAISQYAWGTGIWGIADMNTVLSMSCVQSPLSACWSGKVNTINYGNTAYNLDYAATWGAALAIPDSTMETNWVAEFSGYLKITKPGKYNFGILFDDGFAFSLYGADGQSLSLSSDYLHPRDRLGFADTIALTTGYYRYNLAAYNRLADGVVDLQWQKDNEDWSLIPTENYVQFTSIPEPASIGLLVSTLFIMLIFTRRTIAGTAGMRTLQQNI